MGGSSGSSRESLCREKGWWDAEFTTEMGQRRVIGIHMVKEGRICRS